MASLPYSISSRMYYLGVIFNRCHRFTRYSSTYYRDIDNGSTFWLCLFKYEKNDEKVDLDIFTLFSRPTRLNNLYQNYKTQDEYHLLMNLLQTLKWIL